MALQLLQGALGGAGAGFSASSSASTGPARSGDIGGAQFTFGGINTGTQSSVPPYVWIAALALAAVVAWRMFRR